MSINFNSNCKTRLISFQDEPQQVTIPNITTQNVYDCPSINGPPNLAITIINIKNNYDIKIGNNMFRLVFDPSTKTWNFINNNENLGIDFPDGNKYKAQPQACGDELLVPNGQITVDVKITGIIANLSYVDTYSILINGCFGLIIRGVSVIFTRIFGTGINSNQLSNITNKLLKNEVEIPYINISGQTLIDFSDVGNMIFTIGDKFSYYKEQPLHNTKCITPYPIDVDKLKTTIFNKSCPLMVSVLRGEGLTLLEKANSIYPDKATFPIFYTNLILYGMLKYILSRILYGKFDINFLLRKYNDKFLEDLGSSRFCSFLGLFIDPTSQIFGYNQYFRYNLKK
jgi:hypothetical protein